MVELLIQNGSTVYRPSIEGSIQWTTSRKGDPGKLTFNVLNDGEINFQEGNAVRLTVDGHKVFYGFVFKKGRSKGNVISVTAYDQMRYLKNKDTYLYSNKTASELVKMIAEDFRLNLGTIEDTTFKIANRIEDNKALIDMIQNALDLTLQSRRKLFVLFDDFGALALRDAESMKLNVLINPETAEDFDYSSSIDGETYNKIKLSYENEETGKREIYIAQDSANMNNWGVLQYFESIDNPLNGKAKADAMLQLYNKKRRSLKIKNAFGDPRVRAGSAVPVSLNLGDVVANNYMVVERITHTFENDDHRMDLELKGGVIGA